MTTDRRMIALLAGLGALGGCQLISGLGGLHADGTSTTSAGGGGSGGSSSTISASSSTSSSSSSTSTSSSSSSTSSSSGGCMANLQTDPHHCGQCGHDCAGGACVAGLCQPYVLTPTSTTFPLSTLASDGTYIYWGWIGSANEGAIKRTPIAGDGGENTVADPAGPYHVVSDGQYVYWDDIYANGIMRAPGMGPMSDAKLFNAVGAVSALYLQQQTLFWSMTNDNTISSGQASPAATSVSINVKMSPPTFTLDGSYVYWANGDVLYQQKLPLNVGDLALQIPATTDMSRLVADGDSLLGYVYFTISGTTGSVNRVRKDGSTPSSNMLLAPAQFTDALLVDQSFVYWTNYNAKCADTGALVALRLTTNNSAVPVKLADVAGCSPVAQDAAALYFANGGQIYRVIKPAP